MAPERPAPRPRIGGRDVLLALALLGAFGAAIAGLGAVLDGIAWWFSLILVVTVVLASGLGSRALARHRAWGSLFAAAGAVAIVTVLFAPGPSLLGVVPTPDTFAAFAGLQRAGQASIAGQGIPATADPGILFLLSAGVAALAWVADAAVFSLRMPTLAGIPLLVLVLVPGAVRPELGFVVTALATVVGFLAVLGLTTARVPRRPPLAITAVALAAGLVAPLVLPAVTPGQAGGGVGNALATGLNPIITLGNDLRRTASTLALTYTTDAPTGLYLRLTALTDFSGQQWAPADADEAPQGTVAEIGPIPGITDGVPVSTVTTDVTVASVLSRWLPVPYAPASISGLEGDWGFDPALLSVRSETANARGQDYEVTSVQVAPSVEQLVAAGTAVGPGHEAELALPDDLPPIVASTAREVVGDAATNYEKALALQNWFRGGDFAYSTQAPVDQGYDGSGAGVLEAFLTVKSGYCVHFSSAMAAPSRRDRSCRRPGGQERSGHAPCGEMAMIGRPVTGCSSTTASTP